MWCCWAMWGHFFGVSALESPHGAVLIAWNVLLSVLSSRALSIPAQLYLSLFLLGGALIAEASKGLEAEIAVPSFLIL